MQELFNIEINAYRLNPYTSMRKRSLKNCYSELITWAFTFPWADFLVQREKQSENYALERFGSPQISHQTTNFSHQPVQLMDAFPNLIGTSPLLLPGKPTIPFKKNHNYSLFVPPELKIMDYPDLIGLLYEFSSPEVQKYNGMQRIELIIRSTKKILTSTYNKYKLIAPGKVTLYAEDCTKQR